MGEMTGENTSSSSSEIETLIEKGSQYLRLGKYEKGLRHFNRACTLEPDNLKYQHWRLRAEWLINYSRSLPKASEHERDSLATTMAKGLRCWNPKFDRLRLLHLGYGLFLADLGEYEDSELEAQWLLKNGYKDATKQIRHKIKTCKEKSSMTG